MFKTWGDNEEETTSKVYTLRQSDPVRTFNGFFTCGFR